MAKAVQHSSPLLAQLANELLMVEPNSAELFQACINHVMQHEKAEELVNNRQNYMSSDEDFWGDANDPDDWLHYYRPYKVIDGVLQIPVMGVLLSQFPWQLGRWATGYKYIEMAFRRGLEDPEVKGFALICHSPGGEVTECFELTDKIYEWRDQKPVRAFVANYAYSACMAVASSAGPDNIIITRSGGAGSVGVVTAHVEYSKWMEEVGIKVTFVFAGAHKVDGNPYEKLSASAKKRIQQRIDKIYGVFTSTVARNRDMDEASIRATEALTYDAEEAIEIGFADRIGALDEELVVYTTELADNGDEFMAQPNVTGQKPGTNEDKATGYTQEQMDAAIAEAKAEGVTEGTAAGATAERTRATEIRALDEAATRPAATNMLIEMGATVEQAKTQLAKMPEEKPVAKVEDTTDKTKAKTTRDHFADAMNKSANPNLSSQTGTGDDDDSGTGDDHNAQANAIKAAFGSQAGIKPKAA